MPRVFFPISEIRLIFPSCLTATCTYKVSTVHCTLSYTTVATCTELCMHCTLSYTTVATCTELCMHCTVYRTCFLRPWAFTRRWLENGTRVLTPGTGACTREAGVISYRVGVSTGFCGTASLPRLKTWVPLLSTAPSVKRYCASPARPVAS